MPGGIHIPITGDNSNFINAMNGVRSSVNSTMQQVEASGMSIEDMFKRMAAAAGLVFSVSQAKQWIGQIMNVRGEFQQLEVAFTTMLGSAEKANALMEQLTKTAATTPFDLKGVAAGAKSLMAYGTAAEDVNEMLVRLGDIAAGMSIPLNDLVYLYGTTMVQGRMFTQDLRQFQGRGIPIAEELSKVLNVAKDEIPELVTAGKVTDEVFHQAIVNMTSDGSRFGGLMEAQSKTIKGQISNIEDAIDMMLNDMGKSSEGVINMTLGGVSALVENWQAVGAAILTAAEAFGIYKATLMGMNAWNNVGTNIGYNAEIEALSQIIPLKEKEAASDLQIAVASGRLTEEKALQIVALREEAAAHLENLRAIAAEDAANAESAAQALLLATNKDAEAQRTLDYYQEQYDKIVELGDGFAIERAEQDLNTAASNRNRAAKELQKATEIESAAATKAKASATAVETTQTNINTAAETGNAASTGLLTRAKLALNNAIKAVNASFLGSPIFWIAAAIAGVTFAVYKLVTAESAETIARRKANDEMQSFADKLDEQQNKIKGYIQTLQDETATEYQKAEAWEMLQKLAPSLTEKYDKAALSTLDLADATKEVNEQLENANYDHIKSEIQKWNDTIETIKRNMYNDARYNGGRNASFNNKQLKEAEAQLDTYLDKLAEIDRIRDKMADEARPIQIKLEEAKENFQTKNEIYGFYEKAKLLAERLQNKNEAINYDLAKSEFEDFVTTLQNEVEDLRKDVEGKPADFKLKLQYEEKKKVLDDILNMKSDWSRTGVTTIPLYFQMHFVDAEQARNDAKKTFNYLTGQYEETKVETKTPAQWMSETYKAWQTAERELANFKNSKQKINDADYKKQLKDLTDNVSATKKAYQETGGDVSGKNKKDASEAKKRIEEQRRQQAQSIEEELRYQEELRKIRQESIDARTDASIAAIRNDEQRQRAEQDEQHKRNLRQIEDQAAEMKKAIYEHNKRVWENTHKDSPYELTNEGKAGWMNIQLPKEQQDIINAQINKENEEFDRLIDNRLKTELQASRDFLKQWGDFEQQRLAITQEYEQKINDALSPSEKASLQLQRDKELREMNNERKLEEIDWSGIFSDLQGHTQEYLISLRDQLQGLLDGGNLSIEQMPVIQEKIREINGEISKQNGLFQFQGDFAREQVRLQQAFNDAQKEVAESKQQEAEAQKSIEESTKSIRDLLSSVGIDADVDLDDELLSQFDSNSEEYKQMAKLLETLRVGEGKLAQARNNTAKATNKAKKAEDAAKIDSAQAIAGWFMDAQQFIVEKGLDQIPDLLNELGLGSIAEKASKGLSAFNNAAGAAADFASGNYVGAALKAVSAVKDVVGIFSGGSNHEEQLAIQEELSAKIESSTKAIEKLTEQLSESYGSDAIKAYEELVNTIGDNLRATVLKIDSVLTDNYEGGHSDYYHVNKQTDILSQITAYGRKYNISAKTWQELLSNDAESLAKTFKDIMEQDKQLWYYISNQLGYNEGALGKTIDELVEQYEQLSDADKKLKEQLTNTSFDNVWDSFMDSLYSLADGSNEVFDDVAESWRQMVNKMVLNNLVGQKYKEQLQKWYDEVFSQTYTEGMTEEEYNELIEQAREQYNDILRQGAEDVERLKEIGIVTPSGTAAEDKNATNVMAEKATYDQFEKYLGIATAQQIAQERIKSILESWNGNDQPRNDEQPTIEIPTNVTYTPDNGQYDLIIQNINTMHDITRSNGVLLSEIRNGIGVSNEYLLDIKKSNREILTAMNTRLDNMNNLIEKKL